MIFTSREFMDSLNDMVNTDLSYDGYVHWKILAPENIDMDRFKLPSLEAMETFLKTGKNA